MMLTCNCQHRVSDIQLSPAWNPDSHPPQGISLAGIRFVRFHAVFEKFLQNCVLMPPCSVDTPASGKSWIPNCICWTIRFKYGTGKINDCLKKKVLQSDNDHVNSYFLSCWSVTVRNGKPPNRWQLCQT